MKSNYQHSFIVVSGSYTDLISDPMIKNQNSIIGALTSCFARGCPVIFCDNYPNVCIMVQALSEKLLDGKNRTIPIIEIPIEHDQLRLLCSISGISEKRGQALLDRFGSPMNVFNGSYEDITKIKGIKAKIFNRMIKVLNGKV